MATNITGTAMDLAISTSMTEQQDRVRLFQWLSPAFPIGAFGYSQGLEEPMATGRIRNAADVADWVRCVLEFGTPKMDAVFVRHARRGADPQVLSALLLAYASCAERATELTEQGRAFAALIGGITAAPSDPWPYPVAVGVATRALCLGDHEIMSLFLQGSAAQMISAATRFLPLGQTDGQRILGDLAPLIIRIASEAEALSLDDIASFTPGADMAAMRHETLEVRIFRT